MLSWALFYRSIFETKKAPMVDVADPDGLVRSQAVQSGGLRITLNGAEARRTSAGRFVEETFGASVQHIALARAEFFVTAAILAARDFPLLQIGTPIMMMSKPVLALNQRWSRGCVRQMCCMTKTQAGSFFRVYSAPRPDGFFFEIVQRQGNYLGYGAANASFRIAAQKRSARPAGMPRY